MNKYSEEEFIKETKKTLNTIVYNYRVPFDECHFAILYRYQKNKNKLCMILGKDETNQYNFIGGKINGSSANNNYNQIADNTARTIYHEFCNKFGSIPKANILDFFKSLLYVIKSNNSLLFIFNINGISTKKLNTKKRNSKMNDYKYFFIEDIINNSYSKYSFSPYVTAFTRYIKNLYESYEQTYKPNYNLSYYDVFLPLSNTKSCQQ